MVNNLCMIKMEKNNKFSLMKKDNNFLLMKRDFHK